MSHDREAISRMREAEAREKAARARDDLWLKHVARKRRDGWLEYSDDLFSRGDVVLLDMTVFGDSRKPQVALRLGPYEWRCETVEGEVLSGSSCTGVDFYRPIEPAVSVSEEVVSFLERRGSGRWRLSADGASAEVLERLGGGAS